MSSFGPKHAAGIALLKEFEDSLARCTALYCDDQLARVAPTLVGGWGLAQTGVLKGGCWCCSAGRLAVVAATLAATCTLFAA